MKTNKIFDQYSFFYDLIYKNKDYGSEVRFIDKVIKKYLRKKNKKILSLGCGTCNHDILLAKKGYEITGVDLSSSMLDIARIKIEKAHLSTKVKLINSDIRTMSIDTEHDLAIALFNIVGYQTTNKDIGEMLQSVSKVIQSKGLFLFDCWYMPAVLSDKPTDRIKEVRVGKSELIRLTQSTLNQSLNTIDIKFHVIETQNGMIKNDVEEVHSMRYWSLPELEMHLNTNGFDMIHVCKFLDLISAPDDKEWNIFVIARKR